MSMGTFARTSSDIPRLANRIFYRPSVFGIHGSSPSIQTNSRQSDKLWLAVSLRLLISGRSIVQVGRVLHYPVRSTQCEGYSVGHPTLAASVKLRGSLGKNAVSPPIIEWTAICGPGEGPDARSFPGPCYEREESSRC